MGNSNHTQGEWTVEAKNLIKCNGEQIGSVNSMIDEYEDNAKVMAASKELLEALEIRPNPYNYHNLLEFKNAYDNWEKKICQKAINKATK